MLIATMIKRRAEQYWITGPDFQIANFDGWTLTIQAASTGYPDSWYAKIILHGVSFLDCPIEFMHATFRGATADEQQRIATKTFIGDDNQIVVITAETMADMDVKTFFIVCEAVSVIRKA